jgi:hypothetical protein
MDRRPSHQNQDDGNHQHDHYDRRHDHGAGKPETPDRGHQQRHADNAAEARAIQREADRHAALVVEPEAERIGDDPETGAGPAESKHGIGGVKLPRLGDLADQDGGHRHRYHPRQQAVARAEGTDRFADEGDQQRTEQIEEGRAA